MRKPIGFIGILVTIGLLSLTTPFSLNAEAGDGQGEGQGDGRGPGPGSPPEARNCSVPSLLRSLPAEPLSRTEARVLRYVREEEKLARDVYLSLYQTWRLKVFKKVARSERSHMSWCLILIDRYGLSDPVGLHGVGTFSDPGLQRLYRKLVRQGNRSLIRALEIGATLEDMSIYDLRMKGLNRTDNLDLQALYENLGKASRNHLRTFYALLLARGGDYEPQFISETTFTNIVTSPKEKGVVDSRGDWLCGGYKTGRID